jgi:hypothetical protein
MFYLPLEEEGAGNEGLTAQCMNLILEDIFKALAYNWRKLLGACETHVGILEDKSKPYLFEYS